MKIEVTRPFCLNGDRKETGEQFDVDPRFGRELIHNGKAIAVAEEAPVIEEAPAEARRPRKEKP